jgi:hypothetical protein
MKIFKITIFFAILLAPVLSRAQAGCSSNLDFQKQRVKEPWVYNDLSKSATCQTGQSYEFIVPLTKGRDYRLMFYAAPVFNNKMTFKVIDQSSHQTIMDLPGDSPTNEEGTCVLHDIFNVDSGKMYHPYFDFFPATSTNLKIIIDIKPLPQDAPTANNPNYKAPEKKERGCVTVIVLDKAAAGGSF